MKLTMILISFAILVATLGYFLNRQSQAEAMRLFCWAPLECKCLEVEPALKANNLSVYIDRHLANREVKKAIFHEGINLFSQEGQLKVAAEVEKAQLTSCPLLEILRAEGAHYYLDYENGKIIFAEP